MSNDADIINSTLTESSVPKITPSLATEIELLRGIAEKKDDGTQVWHTLAKFKELTGEDEEALAGLENKKGLTYTEYMNALLARAVTHIGDLEVAKMPGVLNKLILADRDMLFLGVVRATYGLTREVRTLCPHCGESNDVEVNLDEDFPIKQPTFDIKQGIEVHTFKGDYRLRLPNGEDTIEAQKVSKNDAEINTFILSKCVVFDADEEPEDRIEWAKSLNAGVRRQLVNTLLEVRIGPDLEGVDAQCAKCGKDMPLLLDWVSLLLS